MSNTIDQKVVEMHFDNRQFENNVHTSMSTLDKLKRSLNLEGAAKGLDNINNSAKRFDMSGLSSGVETVKAKFSALEVMAVTALANITNSAVNAGKRIVSALTIDPIKTGFQEYETQINAVQTILANTSEKGTTLEDVNSALDTLNTYADKTIYNFTEMTRNIGTFTAAGVDLDTSVNSIKGIANLAAVSGSTSTQASTAMYQLSQALAAGKVSLMDWNSVVNAGMGGEVFQNALIRTSELLGTGAKSAIDTYGSFRESLTQGEWLTTEVLTETLKQFAGAYSKADLIQQGFTEEQAESISKMATTADEAATKVKTFTQLWDTLKEAAQSGWTQSWEIIVGDFEEAKTLLTSISDTIGGMIQKTADARNKVLQGWKDLGGRDYLISGLKNAFEGVLNIVKPVKEAFREIFPPITARQLAKLTESFSILTAKFKRFTEKHGPDIKSAFKGIFSVADIVWTVFKKVAGGIVKLISNFTGLSGGILNAAGSMGDWLSKLRDSVKQSDFFGKAIDKIVDFLQKGIDKIKEFTGLLKKKFESKGFEGFVDILKKAWDLISKIGGKVAGFISGIGSALRDAFSSGNMKSAIDILNGGLFASILLSIKKLMGQGAGDKLSEIFDKLSSPLEKLKEKFAPVKDILDSVRGCLEAYQQNLKASILLKIAGSIAILAAAIWVISTIDSDKLYGALGAMTMMFTELMGSMAIFDKISGKKINGYLKNVVVMIAMSVAILILATALKKIAGLDFNQLATGLIGILGLMVILVGATKYLSQNGKKVLKGAAQMILMAVALKILASACKDLSELSWEELAKGLLGVGILMATVGVFLSSTEFSGKTFGAAAGMVLMAAAIKILASACSDFGDMSWGEIAKGLVSIGALFAEIAIFTNTTGNAKHVLSTSIAMIAISAAIKILASAVKDFSGMTWTELAKGLIGMAVSLAAVTVALNFMPKNMIGIGIGLIAVSAALAILANVLGTMGDMSWSEIAKGLVTLGVSLGLLAIALNLMNGTLAGSAALLIAAAALSILAPALQKLGEMSVGEIIKSLITMAAAFAIIGIAGLVLGPIVPVILALSVAIALLGVGCLAAGIGITMMATGLTALAVALASGASAIVAGVLVILDGLGQAIVLICQAIIDSAPKIGEAINALVLAILDVLITCLPAIAEFLAQFCIDILDVLIEKGPEFTEKLFTFIIGILNALGEKIPELINAGLNIVVNLIDGLAQGIEENAPRMKEAFIHLFESILEAICVFLGIHSPSTVFADIGKNLILGLINGVKNFASSAVNAITTLGHNLVQGIANKAGEFLSKGRELISNLKNGISSKIGEVKTAVTNIVSNAVQVVGSKLSQFRQKGGELMSNLKNGISNKLSSVKSAVTNVISGAISGIKSKISKFTSIGKNMMDGLKNGIKNAAKNVISAAKGVVENAVDAAKNLLGIHSPSRVFAEIGKYTDLGFANGLTKYASKVAEASKGVGKAAITNAKNAISKVGDVITNGINAEPTIRPVVDMSSMNAREVTLTSNLNSNLTSAFSKPVDSLSRIVSDAQSEINASNGKVITAINDLRSDLNAMYSDDDKEIGLYIDGKKLASTIAKPMNRQLNILSQRSGY